MFPDHNQHYIRNCDLMFAVSPIPTASKNLALLPPRPAYSPTKDLPNPYRINERPRLDGKRRSVSAQSRSLLQMLPDPPKRIALPKLQDVPKLSELPDFRGIRFHGPSTPGNNLRPLERARYLPFSAPRPTHLCATASSQPSTTRRPDHIPKDSNAPQIKINSKSHDSEQSNFALSKETRRSETEKPKSQARLQDEWAVVVDYNTRQAREMATQEALAKKARARAYKEELDLLTKHRENMRAHERETRAQTGELRKRWQEEAEKQERAQGWLKARQKELLRRAYDQQIVQSRALGLVRS